MDSARGQRAALPKVLRRIEMFSDVVVCDRGECHTVQIKQFWWIHDDGSYVSANYRADDPLLGDGEHGDDPIHHDFLCRRFAELRRLAGVS